MDPEHRAGRRAQHADSPLDPVLHVTHEAFIAERPRRADEDVHMHASTVEHVIERCTRPGDLVLDPFAGFGTTLATAVGAGRRALGIELLPERVQACQERDPEAIVVEGDARGLLRVLEEADLRETIGRVDLVLTSPPYMTAEGHDADPLTGYEENGGEYRRYVSELELVAAQCARVLAPDGYVVWNVADMHDGAVTTPLINDCRRLLSRHLTGVGMTEIAWDRYPHDLVRDALLVFRRR